MEETLLREAGAHGWVSFALTRAVALIGLGALVADATQPGSSQVVFTFGVGLVLLAAAIERTRE